MYSLERAIGVERITFDEAYIASLYEGLKTPEGRMFVYDGNGGVISSSDKSMLGGDAVKQGAVSEKIEGASGWAKDGASVVFWAEQKNPDWTLTLVEPRSVFSSGKREVVMLTAINIVIIVLFGAAFLFIQNRTIIRPVTRLSKEAVKYREGDYKISTHSAGADEIGQLNRSLQEMSDYIKNLIELEYRSKLAEREMELAYLHIQINPHFLYNTLDTIRWIALSKNQKQIAKQIEDLSDLFRHSLNSGEKYTTVEKELHNLDAYLSLQKARFGDNIEFSFDVDQELLQCRVIKLLIQPLVENAIVHGVEPKRGAGHVNVFVARDGAHMRIGVTDDGVGIDAETIRNYIDGVWDAKRSFALKNIQDRLQLEYGDEFGIHIEGETGVGSRIYIVTPILFEECVDGK
jgi:two-component system sensor histidine kinase YesM